MTQGNPHFYANPVNEDTGGKPMTGQEIGEARRQQLKHAEQHAAAFPAGNSPDVPQRDKRGVLTIPAMRAAIAAGGSVIVPAGPNKGRLATHDSHLPTAADLAEGDDTAEREALAALMEQQRTIDAQMSSLARARANRERSAELAAQRGTPQSPAADPNKGPGDAGHGNFAARPGTDNPNDPGLKQTAPVGDPKHRLTGIDPRGTNADARPLDATPDDARDPRDEPEPDTRGGKGTQTPHGGSNAAMVPTPPPTPPAPPADKTSHSDGKTADKADPKADTGKGDGKGNK